MKKTSITLAKFFEQTYRPQRLLDASEHCVYQYVRNIERLRKLLGREPLLTDLNAATVSSVMAAMRTKGCAPDTCNKVRAQLVAMWRFAVQTQLLTDWPNVRKLVAYRRVPTSWTADEFARILVSAASERRLVGGVPAPLWWNALLLTVYGTGARIGAILQVRWEHFNAEQSTLLIPAEFQKCRQDQIYKLHPQTVAAITLIRQPERELIFDFEKATRNTLHNQYGRILRRAGLPATRRDQFHKLRRTHATLLAVEVGIEAASWSLGHANPSMTREHYVDTSKLPSFVDKLPTPVAPAPEVTFETLEDLPNERQTLILRAVRDGFDLHLAMFGDVPKADNLRAQRAEAIGKLIRRGWVRNVGMPRRPILTPLGQAVLAAVDGKDGAA